MALAGKSAVVKSGANIINGLKEVKFTANGENIEVTTFQSAGWREKLQGLKDVALSLTGFYLPADTNGQVAIRTAWLNGTTISLTYLVDGTVGFTGTYLVTSFEIGSVVEGELSVAIELESTGALTLV
ncbi:phage tail tube protein [Candidatus Formimonas warabiya]|uniref:Phage tail protein n=1 Tax=Formimonas warabiya TaxID=1761012 RepID=A0A3G1KZH7_FORW1|nr:phage tail tube protein [Candidatus Formimonas warabiya]ATW27946.1 hypothetical protein DCMF_27180 [Candidatus Formimonas warabiya]